MFCVVAEVSSQFLINDIKIILRYYYLLCFCTSLFFMIVEGVARCKICSIGGFRETCSAVGPGGTNAEETREGSGKENNYNATNVSRSYLMSFNLYFIVLTTECLV